MNGAPPALRRGLDARTASTISAPIRFRKGSGSSRHSGICSRRAIVSSIHVAYASRAACRLPRAWPTNTPTRRAFSAVGSQFVVSRAATAVASRCR